MPAMASDVGLMPNMFPQGSAPRAASGLYAYTSMLPALQNASTLPAGFPMDQPGYGKPAILWQSAPQALSRLLSDWQLQPGQQPAIQLKTPENMGRRQLASLPSCEFPSVHYRMPERSTPPASATPHPLPPHGHPNTPSWKHVPKPMRGKHAVTQLPLHEQIYCQNIPALQHAATMGTYKYISLEEAFSRTVDTCTPHAENIFMGPTVTELASMALADKIVFQLIRTPYFAKLISAQNAHLILKATGMLKLLHAASQRLRSITVVFGEEHVTAEKIAQGVITYISAVLFAILKLSSLSVSSSVDANIEPLRELRGCLLPQLRSLRMLLHASRMYDPPGVQTSFSLLCCCKSLRQKPRLSCNNLLCMSSSPPRLQLNADNFRAQVKSNMGST